MADRRQHPTILTIPLPRLLAPPLLVPSPLTLPSCSIRKSFVKPDGVQKVPWALSMTTLHCPLAQRCHEFVMQFHCPSEEQPEPTGSVRRTRVPSDAGVGEAGIERAWAAAGGTDMSRRMRRRTMCFAAEAAATLREGLATLISSSSRHQGMHQPSFPRALHSAKPSKRPPIDQRLRHPSDPAPPPPPSRRLALLLQDSSPPMLSAPHHGGDGDAHNDDAAHRDEDGYGNGLLLDVWIADFGESGVAGELVAQSGAVPEVEIHVGGGLLACSEVQSTDAVGRRRGSGSVVGFDACGCYVAVSYEDIAE
ncbi:hypothetical protein S40293_11339 [Stachybotrys chartarum IBT 40293]|nr:hypothetical protein S40293_11339 [Stachybotrys chartarum IBT 40293]